MKNGWKRIAYVATTIVAVGGAATVLAPYSPWAPRITFALATENTLDRLDNQLISLLILEAQAKAVKDELAIRYLTIAISNKRRQIAETEKLKEKNE